MAPERASTAVLGTWGPVVESSTPAGRPCRMAGTTFPPNAPTLAGAVSGELQTAPWVPVKAGPAIPSLLCLQHMLHTALPGIAHLHKPPAPAAQSLPTHDMCGTRNIVTHTATCRDVTPHKASHTARVVTSHERYTMRAVTSHKGYTAREVTLRKRSPHKTLHATDTPPRDTLHPTTVTSHETLHHVRR